MIERGNEVVEENMRKIIGCDATTYDPKVFLYRREENFNRIVPRRDDFVILDIIVAFSVEEASLDELLEEEFNIA